MLRLYLAQAAGALACAAALLLALASAEQGEPGPLPAAESLLAGALAPAANGASQAT